MPTDKASFQLRNSVIVHTRVVLGWSGERIIEDVVLFLVGLQWHRWRVNDLLTLVKVIVQAKAKFAHTLTKAFYIFDPVRTCYCCTS